MLLLINWTNWSRIFTSTSNARGLIIATSHNTWHTFTFPCFKVEKIFTGWERRPSEPGGFFIMKTLLITGKTESVGWKFLLNIITPSTIRSYTQVSALYGWGEIPRVIHNGTPLYFPGNQLSSRLERKVQVRVEFIRFW